jgi:uncharacterized protein YcsI (UPF0317 family)
MVTFFLGSSVSLDGYLSSIGMGPSWGPCIYISGVMSQPVSRYSGPVALTMRSYPKDLAEKVSEMTGHFPWCHGAPLSWNDPKKLGIGDEQKIFLPFKDGGFPSPNDIKLYWACGITPSLVAKAAKLPLMIVHTPGNALITDIPTKSLFDQALPQ